MRARNGRARTPPLRIFLSPISQASPNATSAAAGSGRGTGQIEQTLLGTAWVPAGCRRAAVIGAVGIEVPGRGVGQLGLENGVESAAAGRVAHRGHHLDPVP